MTLFFPPLRCRQEVRTRPLDFARKRKSRTADFRKAPSRLDADIDVYTARAAGLGPAPQAGIAQDSVHFQSDLAHVPPDDTGAGVEIDAQLVGVIKIVGADSVGMKLDAAKIDDPRQARRIVHNNLFRGASGGKRQGYCAQPGWAFGGRALLIESLFFRSVDESLKNDRPVADAIESAGSDGQVIADDIELGELHLPRKVRLLWTGDTDFPPVDGQQLSFGFLFHALRLHRAAAARVQSSSKKISLASLTKK